MARCSTAAFISRSSLFLGLLQQVLTDCDAWEERERKLNLHAMVYLIIVLALFPRLSHCHVLAKVTAGLRHLWPEEEVRLPSKAALATRRGQFTISHHTFQETSL